jgi:hypothetical protein
MRAEQQLIDARTASLSAASRFSLAYGASRYDEGILPPRPQPCEVGP